MNKVGNFEKVSYERFFVDMHSEFGDKYGDAEIEEIYNSIKLPTRATKGSAGYDFFSPLEFSLSGWQDIKIPTGIRVAIDDGWFLTAAPRSGMGFKNYVRFANVPPVVDSDYFGSSNEGHIWMKIRVERDGGAMTVAQGAAFAQSLFLPYGITYDDATEGVRDGGFGSTDGK